MFSPSSTFARFGILSGCVLGGCVLALACAPYTTGDIGQSDEGGLTTGSSATSD